MSARAILDKLKIASHSQNDQQLASFLEVSINTLKAWVKNDSIPLPHILSAATKTNLSLDWLVNDSSPRLYQLAKKVVDGAIDTDMTQKLETYLNEFLLSVKIKKAIKEALLVPLKELPFYESLLSAVSTKEDDFRAVVKLFGFVLENVDAKNPDAKVALLEAVKTTPMFQIKGLSYFFPQDVEHLITVIESLDTRICRAIIDDIPGVIEKVGEVVGEINE